MSCMGNVDARGDSTIDESNMCDLTTVSRDG